MNQHGKNDYTTGLTLDLGPGATGRFDALNVEGTGFGGWSNLLSDASDFGRVRRLAVVSTTGAGGVRLFADGKPNGKRDRAESLLHMDDFFVGARCYNNEGGPANARGFLSGAVLEVLVYGRGLSDDELKKVDDYLAARHGKDVKIVPPRGPDGRQTARPRRRPAAGADARAGLHRPPAAARPAQHQQRPLPPRRQARRPRLQRRRLPAFRRQGNGIGGQGGAILGEQGRPARPDRHGPDAARLPARRRRVRRLQGQGVADRGHGRRRQGRQGNHRRRRLEGDPARRRRPRRGPGQGRQPSTSASAPPTTPTHT